MSRTPVNFRKADMERAVLAAIATGLPILRTEISKDGRITLFHAEVPVVPVVPETPPTPAWPRPLNIEI